MKEQFFKVTLADPELVPTDGFFSNNGKYLTVVDNHSGVHFFSVKAQEGALQEVDLSDLNIGATAAVAYRMSEGWLTELALASESQIARINLKTDQELEPIPARDVRCLAYAEDYLVVGLERSRLEIWDISAVPVLVERVKLPEVPIALKVDRYGTIYVATESGLALVWTEEGVNSMFETSEGEPVNLVKAEVLEIYPVFPEMVAVAAGNSQYDKAALEPLGKASNRFGEHSNLGAVCIRDENNNVFLLKTHRPHAEFVRFAKDEKSHYPTILVGSRQSFEKHGRTSASGVQTDKYEFVGFTLAPNNGKILAVQPVRIGAADDVYIAFC